jgi:uncharacterized protein YecT (DUF1311 family)
VRHVLVHELPSTSPYEQQETQEFLNATAEFVAASDEVLLFQLYGAVPLTQGAMTADAWEELQRREKRLAALVEQVKELGDADSKILDAAQEAWKNFVELDARLYSNLSAGGSAEPMENALAKTRLINQRIEQLEWWVKPGEGEL